MCIRVQSNIFMCVNSFLVPTSSMCAKSLVVSTSFSVLSLSLALLLLSFSLALLLLSLARSLAARSLAALSLACCCLPLSLSLACSLVAVSHSRFLPLSLCLTHSFFLALSVYYGPNSPSRGPRSQGHSYEDSFLCVLHYVEVCCERWRVLGETRCLLEEGCVLGET